MPGVAKNLATVSKIVEHLISIRVVCPHRVFLPLLGCFLSNIPFLLFHFSFSRKSHSGRPSVDVKQPWAVFRVMQLLLTIHSVPSRSTCMDIQIHISSVPSYSPWLVIKQSAGACSLLRRSSACLRASSSLSGLSSPPHACPACPRDLLSTFLR